MIRCDNGPEFISHEFVRWATEHGIRIEYIQPGKPQQNTYIERYNRTIRYSWLIASIYLILSWMKYKIIQQTGCGITTMKDHIKLTKESHL